MILDLVLDSASGSLWMVAASMVAACFKMLARCQEGLVGLVGCRMMENILSFSQYISGDCSIDLSLFVVTARLSD